MDKYHLEYYLNLKHLKFDHQYSENEPQRRIMILNFIAYVLFSKK
jgi:hypothetical protein